MTQDPRLLSPEQLAQTAAAHARAQQQVAAEIERQKGLTKQERAAEAAYHKQRGEAAQAELNAQLAANPAMAASYEAAKAQGEAEFQRILAQEMGNAQGRVNAAMPSFQALVQSQMGYVRGLIGK